MNINKSTSEFCSLSWHQFILNNIMRWFGWIASKYFAISHNT